MQGGIKNDFLSLWYDSTWDWTQVSGTIGEHSNHLLYYLLICNSSIVDRFYQYFANKFYFSLILKHNYFAQKDYQG